MQEEMCRVEKEKAKREHRKQRFNMKGVVLGHWIFLGLLHHSCLYLEFNFLHAAIKVWRWKERDKVKKKEPTRTRTAAARQRWEDLLTEGGTLASHSVQRAAVATIHWLLSKEWWHWHHWLAWLCSANCRTVLPPLLNTDAPSILVGSTLADFISCRYHIHVCACIRETRNCMCIELHAYAAL